MRSILTSGKFEVPLINNNQINKMLKRYPFLSDIPDHRIICSAEIYAAE